MENNVIQLEAGNLEADDSEIKQKYGSLNLFLLKSLTRFPLELLLPR